MNWTKYLVILRILIILMRDFSTVFNFGNSLFFRNLSLLIRSYAKQTIEVNNNFSNINFKIHKIDHINNYPYEVFFSRDLNNSKFNLFESICILLILMGIMSRITFKSEKIRY